jgi:hypothetical protein
MRGLHPLYQRQGDVYFGFHLSTNPRHLEDDMVIVVKTAKVTNSEDMVTAPDVLARLEDTST